MQGILTVVATLVFALGSIACRNESQLGPYVRDIARDGDTLVVKKCTIVLLGGKDLSETGCTEQRIPLGSLPPPTPTPPSHDGPSVEPPAPR